MRDFVGPRAAHLSPRDVTARRDRYDEVVDELASELEARYTALIQRGSTRRGRLEGRPGAGAFMAGAGSGPGAPAPAHARRSARHGCARSSRSNAGCGSLPLALRVLRKDRGFTVTAIVTLAVCLGGHAAIVAGVNAMLFHPLRVPEPDRVLLMANQYPLVEARRGTRSSTPDYDDRLRHVTVFEEQAFYNFSGAHDRDRRYRDAACAAWWPRHRSSVSCASHPAHGRIFTEDEGDAWQRRPDHPHRRAVARALWRRSGGHRAHASSHRT